MALSGTNSKQKIKVALNVAHPRTYRGAFVFTGVDKLCGGMLAKRSSMLCPLTQETFKMLRKFNWTKI